ncbi:MAG: S8 family serine peptidase [Flavobacteriales bacterium]|nr:S8 family serine peptidase [Flavobacteriales bacterium]
MITQLSSKLVFTFFLFTLFQFGFRASAQTADPNAVDGHLHIKLSADPGLILDGYTGGNLALDLLFATSGLDSIYKPFPLAGTALDSVYRVVFPNAAQVNALIPALEALPYIEYVEKNPMVFSTHTPNDLQENQWSLAKINAELGWNYSTGSGNVLVAVLDNAIAIDHADLAANIYTNTAETGGLPFLDDDLNGRADDINGFDVVDNDANPRPPANASGNGDGFTHGTHVAGIAGAATNNGTGMASIGYSVKILPVKIAGNANGALSGGLDGVFYAMRSGADVISMSWGLLNDVATFKTIIQQAAASNIVLVAAAGNEGDQTIHYPAAYPEVISVGATDQNDQKAGFSNFGSTVDVMAPGVDIYSTLPEGNNTYGNYSGTSMATPMVAGLAALVKSHFPSMTANQIRQRIEQGCDNISAQNPGMNGMLGAGRINAFQTLGNVSISELNGGTFSIYPNPTIDRINFKKSITDDVSRISILDVSGREVVSSSWVESLDVSHLASGIYTVLIDANGKLSQTKMMIQ